MKNNLYRKGFIVPMLLGVIAILIIGGGIYIYQNKKVEAPIVVNKNIGLDNKQEVPPVNNIVKDKSIKTFKLGTLEFSYPETLSFNKINEYYILDHSVPFKHQNSCDFEGDAPMLNEVTDFNSSYKIFKLSMIETIKSGLGYDLSSIPKESEKIVTKTGSIDGYKITSGVEGCGQYYYFFPITANETLVITRGIYLQTLQSGREKLTNLPGFISQTREEQIFKDILSSIKVL